MKRFALISFILLIGAIIISSFFFIGTDSVKDSTKNFIEEIIKNNASSQLTAEENAQIKAFFESFKNNSLPHPVIEGIEIPYYDVFTEPTVNDQFFQYISVKYEPVDNFSYDTDIHFEFILYNKKDGNSQEIYFGKLTTRTFETDIPKTELISVQPMQKQK